MYSQDQSIISRPLKSRKPGSPHTLTPGRGSSAHSRQAIGRRTNKVWTSPPGTSRSLPTDLTERAALFNDRLDGTVDTTAAAGCIHLADEAAAGTSSAGINVDLGTHEVNDRVDCFENSNVMPVRSLEHTVSFCLPPPDSLCHPEQREIRPSSVPAELSRESRCTLGRMDHNAPNTKITRGGQGTRSRSCGGVVKCSKDGIGTRRTHSCKGSTILDPRALNAQTCVPTSRAQPTPNRAVDREYTMSGVDGMEKYQVGTGSMVRPWTASGYAQSSNRPPPFDSGNIWASKAEGKPAGTVLSSRPLIPTTATCSGGNRTASPPPRVADPSRRHPRNPRLVLDFSQSNATISAAEHTGSFAHTPSPKGHETLASNHPRCSKRPPRGDAGRIEHVPSVPPPAQIRPANPRGTERQGDADASTGASPSASPRHVSKDASPTRTPPLHNSTSTVVLTTAAEVVAANSNGNPASPGKPAETLVTNTCITGTVSEYSPAGHEDVISDPSDPARPMSAPQLLPGPPSSALDSRDYYSGGADRCRNSWKSYDQLKGGEDKQNFTRDDHTATDRGQISGGSCSWQRRFDGRSVEVRRQVATRPQSARSVRTPSTPRTSRDTSCSAPNKCPTSHRPKQAEIGRRTFQRSDSTATAGTGGVPYLPTRPLSASQRRCVDAPKTDVSSNVVPDNKKTSPVLQGLQVSRLTIKKRGRLLSAHICTTYFICLPPGNQLLSLIARAGRPPHSTTC